MGKIVKWSNFQKTIHYIKKNGIRQTYYAVRERVHTEQADHYTYEPVSGEELERQREENHKFGIKFSILVPVYEPVEDYFRAMIESVLDQTYENFELILADAGTSDLAQEVVQSYGDNRIIYKRLKQNAGIAANSNQALMYASGDYACLLDHDDVLTPDALYQNARCIAEYEEKNIQLQMLYSDEDKCDSSQSTYYEVNNKPEFNLDLILSNNYICHFLVVKRQLLQELGFRSVCDGAQDFDVVLRTVNVLLGKDKGKTRKQELPIAHIPRVLYHWRCYDNSTSQNPASKQYAYDAGKRAVEDFLRARGWRGTVLHTRHLGFYRVDYQPDLLANRPDTAVVGGKLLDKKNKIAGGIYTFRGEPVYYGIHKEYSGYMHRASLQQEAEMVDVRCMTVSGAGEAILEEMLGLPYLRNPKNGRFDWRDCLNDSVDYQELSRCFCEKIREKGFRIVWDPNMIEKIN